jgi:hypothetical protein
MKKGVPDIQNLNTFSEEIAYSCNHFLNRLCIKGITRKIINPEIIRELIIPAKKYSGITFAIIFTIIGITRVNGYTAIKVTAHCFHFFVPSKILYQNIFQL